jgi:sigma-B regulation protein RsbU (phosphoserine phosphatase)
MTLPLTKYLTLPRSFIILLALALLAEWLHLPNSLLWIALTALGLILAYRLIRLVLRQSIWRLRNRLIVTYIFIAVVPIALILALAAIGTWIVVGQVAVYLVTSRLERQSLLLEGPAHFLADSAPNERDKRLAQIENLLQQEAPGFELIISDGSPTHYPPESHLDLPADDALASYTGYIEKDGRYYCFASARSGTRRAVVVEPMNAELLARLQPGIGRLTVRGAGPTNPTLNPDQIAGKVPAAFNVLDFETPWFGQLSLLPWQNPRSPETAILVVETRPSAVFQAVFGGKMDEGQNWLVAFLVIASALLVVELLSLVIGVSLTRSVTQAVAGLYGGTLNIAKGDFSWRIPVRGADQLAALGHSFNNMTAQLQNLVEVAKEKERLQSEIKIASEVQNQLFPHKPPALRTIELMGACQAARTVSGDYYDYLCLQDGNLAFAIGDVAGKGISAALLMASIQSILRTLLAAGVAHDGGADSRFSTAHAVEQLNRELYASTAPEKYATFFFGVYDEATRTLKYTNAGHLPPLLMQATGSRLLDPTGTVVGLFPSIRYEERQIEIAPGDVLVAYTDGITESENSYGEEFGLERLAEIVARNREATASALLTKIFEAAALWNLSPEQADDITLLVAKGI